MYKYQIPYNDCSDLVEFLQNQLVITTSAISILQTSSMLAPIRAALQAVVSLHAIVLLIRGFANHEDEKMICYCRNLIQDDNYQRIIPSTILSLFQKIGSSSVSTSASSFAEVQSLSQSSLQSPPKTPLQSPLQSPKRNTNTTIIINDSLLQQHSLLQ